MLTSEGFEDSGSVQKVKDLLGRFGALQQSSFSDLPLFWEALVSFGAGARE